MSKLTDFVANYRKTNPSGWRKWVYGSVVALIVLTFGIIFAVREYLRQSAIARLQHERDVLEEEAKQHAVDQVLAVTSVARESYKVAAEAAYARVQEIDRQVGVLQESHEANLAVINSLRSWGDVDANVK